MDYFYLLNEFIDGEIEPEKEEMLFRELGSNDELRTKFRNILAVKSAVNSNMDYFMPDVSASAAVFSSLGISNHLTGNAVASEPVKPKNIFSGLIGGYRGMILASAITAAIILLLINPLVYNGHDTTMSNKQLAANTPVPVLKSTETLSPGKISSNQNDIQKQKTIIKYIYVPYAVNNDPGLKNEPVTIEENAAVSNEVLLSQPVQSVKLKTGRLKKTENPAALIPGTGFNNDFASNDAYDKALGFSVEVNNFQNQHLPEPTINPKRFVSFNNTSAAVYYKISDDIEIGADIRQENFFQRFHGIDSDGIPKTFEQTPNFTSYNLAVRYLLADLGMFQPVVQLMIGANDVGIIGRSALGARYLITDHFAFGLGFEYSYFAYNFQGSSFNSSKIGFIYGLSYSF